jgi:hypothetical protein
VSLVHTSTPMVAIHINKPNTTVMWTNTDGGESAWH